MSKIRGRYKYLLLDIFASIIAWTCFYVFRKLYIEPIRFGYSVPIEVDHSYFIALIVIPAFWVFLYWLIGSYKKIYRKSRIKELINTFIITFIGTIILFFTLLLDDYVPSYHYYPILFSVLFSLQFFFVFLFRFILLSRLKRKLKNREIGFNTLLIGNGKTAGDLYDELENEKFSQGYKFIGVIPANGNTADPRLSNIPVPGTMNELPNIIKNHKVEEVIIALNKKESSKLKEIISRLEGVNVVIKILPDMYDILSGSVKIDYLFGTALMEINPVIMPEWQQKLKRFLDFTVSLVIIVLFFPAFLVLAALIYFTSKGPVFYKQERIGKGGLPFNIYKFRTMKQNAEQNGPMLSSDFDPRITKVGRVFRKYRLDELPQFYNVLKGDMSLVGPRPERQYFINQIVKVAPHYSHLLKVKPGITSWGQVKFGYAENIDEMVERLKFDVLYIENMSLSMDFKILFYTVYIIFKGSGK